jgi:hypothetical protein
VFGTLTAILVLITFLVPGFVWRTVEGQLVYLDKGLEWEKFAFGLLTRSTFVYLPFAALIYRGYAHDWINKYPVWTGIAAVGFVIVLPTVGGLIAGIARQRRLGPRVIRKFHLGTFEQHHIPTAWDYLFSTIQPAWVVITLKNQNKVYGYMGPNSYISSDSKERDIFISHVLVAGPSGKMELAANTRGVYIAFNEVSSIEFTAP